MGGFVLGVNILVAVLILIYAAEIIFLLVGGIIFAYKAKGGKRRQ